MSIPLDAQFIDVPIFNQLVPGEGPKSIRAMFDFGTADSFSVDLTLQQESGVIKAVQTIFFDASELIAPAAFVAPRSQQRLIVMPQTQGYLPFLLANPPVFDVSSLAGAGSKLTINMLNVPMAPYVWAADLTP